MQMIRSGDNRKTQLLSQLDQKIFFSEETASLINYTLGYSNLLRRWSLRLGRVAGLTVSKQLQVNQVRKRVGVWELFGSGVYGVECDIKRLSVGVLGGAVVCGE